jgi:threonine/homoserine/homoserine lactone efflux protein
MLLTGLLPDPAQAVTFAVAVFVLNATPGVDFLLTVSRTLQGGPRAGVAAVAGINAGCVVHALMAAFGLASLLALHPQAFRAIQVAGAAYLVWLGLEMLRQAWRGESTLAMVPGAPLRSTWWADFRVGLMTNVLNPKVALFFLAFLPQFVPAASPQKTLSFLLLGAWFIAQGGLFSLGLVALAARLSRMRSAHRTRRGLNGLGGGLFLALAWRIFSDRPSGA